MAETSEVGRKLRIKERRTYTDEGIDDDEIEGKRTFDLEDRLSSKKYNRNFVLEMKGDEFNLKFMQKNGLRQPIVIYDKTGLGMRVPSQNFRVSDVKQCVGSRRILDVMDVNTQKGKEMTMREWVQYFESTERERLLNVISLEFSHTKLENYVESPTLVRQIDWVDTVWPRYLKEGQIESTNIIEKMKYPKVQKYCLMSVAGCFTDFHIDFGGTSVWYHILHGEKVFWLIPPTEKNLETYVNWTLSGKQGDIFLADHVDGCQRIELKEGYTFIIPSGWIHAVYTPKDSLVFGGNFLHCFNIVNQLKATEMEDRTHVKQKFRYPFYAEIAWYVLAQYLKCVNGKQCLDIQQHEDKENNDLLNTEYDDDSRPPSRCSQDNETLDLKHTDSKDNILRPSTPRLDKSVMIELTRIDHSSTKFISDDDCASPAPARRRSPRKSSSDSCSSADTEIYEQPEEVASQEVKSETEIKTEVKNEKNSVRNSDKGDVKNERPTWKHLTRWDIEGLSHLVQWLEGLPPGKKGIPKDLLDPASVLQDIKQLMLDHQNDDPELAVTGDPILAWPPSKIKKIKQKTKLPGAGPKKAGKGSPSSNVRRRRTRCKKCEPCTRTDCGECNFCKDMKKFGGPGRMKQSCTSRQCLAPVLPGAATCMICNADDSIKGESVEDAVTKLMECGICWEIVHPDCLAAKYENLDNNGIINEDLPNSWECPKCCHDGKQGQLKPRIMKGQSTKGSKSADTSAVVTESRLEADDEVEGKRVTVRQSMAIKESAKDKEDDYNNQYNETEENTESKVYSSSDGDNDTEEGYNDEDEEITFTPQKKRYIESDKKSSTIPKRTSTLGKLKKGKKESGLKKNKIRHVNPQQKKTLLTIINKRKSNSGIKLPLKRKREEEPENDEEGPVVTRSGRTVKKSPQLTDKNIASDIPRKRPRREGRFGSPTSGYQKKGLNSHTQEESPVQKLRQSGPRISEVPDEKVCDDQTPSTSNVKTPKKALSAGNNQKGSKKRGVNTQSGSGSSKKRNIAAKGLKSENQIDKLSTTPGKGDGQAGHGQIILKEPKVVLQRYVVRPAPIPPPLEYVMLETGRRHALGREIWMKIFRYLSVQDLTHCLEVNKTFYRWCMHHSLWRHLNFSKTRICQPHLMAIVKRQPYSLNLDSVVMYQRQLTWLLQRIPQLQELSLRSCSWATVSALCLACPLLKVLDISWTTSLSTQGFQDILSPLTDKVPGMKDVSRLHKVHTLSVAGTEITDDSMSDVAEHLIHLKELDLSYCVLLSDEGIKMLLSTDGQIRKSLVKIDLSGCKRISECVLEELKVCKNLKEIVLKNCSGIPQSVLAKAAQSSKIKLVY